MNGVSLVSIQNVLAGSAGSRLAPRLQSIQKDIAANSLAQSLMTSDSSKLGAFLRLVRDAQASNEIAGGGESLELPKVELRKELDSIEDASLEDLLAILISIRDLLVDAAPIPGYSTEGADVLSALLSQADTAAYGRGDGGKPGLVGREDALAGKLRWKSEAPAGSFSSGDGFSPAANFGRLNDGENASGLRSMVARLLGGENFVDPAWVAESPGAAAEVAFPGFRTDAEGRRATVEMSEALAATAASTPAIETMPVRQTILPDLVYFPIEGQRDASSPAQASARSIQLISLQGLSGSDPVQTLQRIVSRVEEIVRDRRRGSGNAERLVDSSMESFFQSRLTPQASSGLTVRMSDGARLDMAAQLDVAADAVRQAQAALADMAERRMNGDVTLDSDRMRAVMHLEPPVLGRMHIEMCIDDAQRVVVHVGADRQDTQDFLKEHQSDLRQGLAHQGFDPDQVEIEFDETQAGVFGQWLAGAATVAV